MSRKGTIDVFQTKTTRNDRFAQMSHQEKIIEQKKREIQARLELKQKNNPPTSSETKASSSSSSKKGKSPAKDSKIFNHFSNDGSFLDQFKQIKDKKMDSKLKSFRSNQDRSYNDDRNKSSRWSQRRRSPSPKTSKPRFSRFSDKPPNSEPKINISTSYSNLISQANFSNHLQSQISISTQSVIGQPLLKNDLPPPGVAFPTPAQSTASIIAAPPVILSVPPPQVLQQPVSVALVVPPPSLTTANILTSVSNTTLGLPPPTVLTPLNLPPPTATVQVQGLPTATIAGSAIVGLRPPSCIPTIELSSIPPPNPIQIQNIPQPEPINALNIPPPAPLQVQNIPPPSPIQLNEIPNPKPMDVLSIPTPSDGSNMEKAMSDPDFIKSIPPPNKSIPPPSLQDTSISVNITVPPPSASAAVVTSQVPTCLPPPTTLAPTSVPPPQSVVVSQAIAQNISVSSMPQQQSIIVHSIPPHQGMTTQNVQMLQSIQTVSIISPQTTTLSIAPPPPPPQVVHPSAPPISVAISIQNAVGVLTPSTVTVANVIPSLMAQPILPPPGMGVAPPPVNIHCPPPVCPPSVQETALQALPSFVNQPPPITNQMPPMNIPPPSSTTLCVSNTIASFKDINTVCPPGTADYEAMASLGRMVAQCGPGIEDIVCQRKPQDPNLWFLFHKESAAYQQYQQLVEQFKSEQEKFRPSAENYEPDDIYEPEMATDDEPVNIKFENVFKQEPMLFFQKTSESMFKSEDDDDCSNSSAKRKRKSRWGEKDLSIPPPTVVLPATSGIAVSSQVPLLPSLRPTSPVMLSKITRNDPALIQYVIATYGGTNISEEDWIKAEEHYKINLVYQEMLRKREEIDRLSMAGKNKYDYDSDEEQDGGTWEHKLREKEMTATQTWATELTKHAEGKHHIGDFLPPDELRRFIEKTSAVKEGRPIDLSDYKDFKIKEDNVGFKMLQKLGWSEGQGLGANSGGIVEPVNKATVREQNQGLGLNNPGSIDNADDEYDAYRKRMMLAYRFRPNPLNNPRRPYY